LANNPATIHYLLDRVALEQDGVGPKQRCSMSQRVRYSVFSIREHPIQVLSRIRIGHGRSYLYAVRAQAVANIRTAIRITAGLGFLAQAITFQWRKGLIEDGHYLLVERGSFHFQKRTHATQLQPMGYGRHAFLPHMPLSRLSITNNCR
jgi:hypothetical protein